jgi:two-component system, NarL family, sensor histidine kinase UhpB
MPAVTQCNAEAAREKQAFPWRDAALVVLATVAVGFLSARLELSESLFDATRNWEHLQLDEAPATLLVLAIGLAWFAWRRYAEASRELAARRDAELKLAALLQDHRRLAQQYVQFQESERKALARELHDELGQYLNAIKTDAVAIQTKSLSQETPIARGAGAIVAHCDHLQAIVRGLIGRLRPVGLDVLGLRAALEHLLEDAQRRAPEHQMSIALEGELDELDEDTSLTIYRLAQEGLTNIARHAAARSISVSVIRKGPRIQDRDVVEIALMDDGRGADLTKQTLGLGLRGMRERVEMLQGELQVTSAPGCGFRIVACLPVARTAAPVFEVAA